MTCSGVLRKDKRKVEVIRGVCLCRGEKETETHLNLTMDLPAVYSVIMSATARKRSVSRRTPTSLSPSYTGSLVIFF